jgi:hypothetical protein
VHERYSRAQNNGSDKEEQQQRSQTEAHVSCILVKSKDECCGAVFCCGRGRGELCSLSWPKIEAEFQTERLGVATNRANGWVWRLIILQSRDGSPTHTGESHHIRQTKATLFTSGFQFTEHRERRTLRSKHCPSLFQYGVALGGGLFDSRFPALIFVGR